MICDQLKMIPVIDMENFQTFYNCKKKIRNKYNSWEYYFEPVSKFKLKKVYKSKNVLFCDNKTSKSGFSIENYSSDFKYFNGFQFLDYRHKKIVKNILKFMQIYLLKLEQYIKNLKRIKFWNLF